MTAGGATNPLSPATIATLERLGLRRIADLHALAYRDNPDARITAVCDADAQWAKRRAGEWGAERTCTDYREVPWDGNAVIVLGAEGAGLRPRVRDVCTHLVRIPMRGSVGSLNLSTAASVLAFEAVREIPWAPGG